MPAHSEKFPWPSYDGRFNFFEDRMRSHKDVVSLKYLGDGLYELVRQNGEILRVFVCQCYAFGVAQYLEAIDHFRSLDAIIIDSSWCGYTLDAKHYCRNQKVGMFKISDFMAALNRKDFWKYLNKDEIKYFRKKGWG